MGYQTLSYTPPFLQAQPGSEIRSGGGGTPVVGARSALDMRRMMQSGRVPDAQYPDGYLGSSTGRHQDKLLQSYGASARYDGPHDRGVHKGERLDRSDYFWPPWMDLTAGIRNQATGKRWALHGRPADVPSMPGSNATPHPQPAAASDLTNFAPTWR